MVTNNFTSCTYLVDSGLGILISGGDESSNQYKSVEIWSSKVHCQLPEFEIERKGHSQEGLLACSETTCEKFENGNWVQAFTLTTRRSYHVSWKTENGILLMGGNSSPETTDLLEEGGQVVQGFPLKEYVS